MEYKITHDFAEIVSGSDSVTSPVYMEAATSTKSYGKTSAKQMNAMLKSIGRAMRGHHFSPVITESEGNIDKFKHIDNTKDALRYLSKILPDDSGVNSLNDLLKAVTKNKKYYVDAYRDDIEIVRLEYDCAIYLLIEGISTIITNKTEPKIVNSRLNIVKRSSGRDKGITMKTVKDMSDTISNSNHVIYLKSFFEAAPKMAVKMEAAAVQDTIDLVKHLWTLTRTGFTAIKTVVVASFKVVPIIRTIVYFHYKKKADTISALETQAAFVQLNIEQLKNQTNIDPKKKEEIIKKQEAYVRGYLKRAEKLRAQLVETEKEATDAINEDNARVQKEKDDDDFILD